MRRFVAESLGRIAIAPRRKLKQAKMPIVPAGRIRVEAERMLHLLDAAFDVADIGGMRAVERPRIGVVGVDLQRFG